jgi:tetratricopeptide (TPR) repeat protein
MKTRHRLISFCVMISLSGCAGFRAATNVESGREAFLIGNNEKALGYFQSAAQIDSNYVYGTELKENVWSYVGRSEYSIGELQKARNDLEKALSINRGEDMARLYLGLTLARSGDPQQGLKEIQAGMRGISDWLEYIARVDRYSFGQFWDTRREIRSAIQSDLAMIDSKALDWEKLISDGEWLGKRVEEEINLARRDEREDRMRDTSGRGG